jgi:hypothetical protein
VIDVVIGSVGSARDEIVGLERGGGWWREVRFGGCVVEVALAQDVAKSDQDEQAGRCRQVLPADPMVDLLRQCVEGAPERRLAVPG